MKKYFNFKLEKAMTIIGAFMLLFLTTPLMAQIGADGIVDELKEFLTDKYATEGAFVLFVTGASAWIISFFNVELDRYKQLITLGLTAAGAILGYVLQLGIFGHMGLIQLVIFIISTTFTGNGFFTWLKKFRKNK